MVDGTANWFIVRSRNNNMGADRPAKQRQMKILLTILLFALISCTDAGHEVRYSPSGNDSVVYVKYFDGQQFTTFYMSYPAFKTIYDSLDYEGCYDYYREHQLPAYWQKEYSKYKRK